MRKLLCCMFAVLMLAGAACDAGVSDDNHLKIKDLRVLIVVYRGETDAEPAQRIDDAELGLIKGAIECGRRFYFRNSFGKLCLTVSYELIDTIAPDNSGPTYDNIVADLRSRGFVNNQFDGLYTTGVGLGGNFGGFQIFDKTGAAFSGGGGGGQLSQYPSADKSVGYDWSWGFVHEFQHALDLSIAGTFGFQEFVHGHPYADLAEQPDRPIVNPGGMHWDWEACTLRNFKDYLAIPGATSSYIYALDSDGDGLADRHPTLPMDEERFGSNPLKKDTDGDGLSDLDEFTADIYFGSDPRDMDSDGDGMPDGDDMWPTVAINKSMEYAYPTPAIDGEIESVYAPLITRSYATNWEELPKDAVQTFACWDEENLYLAAKGPSKFNLNVYLDTSAHNGFWEGGDTYLWSVPSEGQPVINTPRIPEWKGAKAAWSTDEQGNTVVEMVLPARIGQGWSREVNYGGIRLPEDIVDGMVLLDGRGVSFNFQIDFPSEGKRVLLNPTWTMISTRLTKDARDPDLPILRYSEAMQNLETPVVRVDGVSAKSRVEIIDEKGRVLGKRRGSGEVELEGVKVGSEPESGRNVITAVTSAGKKSGPFELVVDTGANPPKVTSKSIEGGKTEISISGEPNAEVTLTYRQKPDESLPLLSVQLDDQGKATVELDNSMRGFRGEYFDDERWTSPMMYRLDPSIDFDYQAGSPMRGMIDPESFSVRWTGYMKVDTTTVATFHLTTDDGSGLYIDGELVIENWGHHPPVEKSAEVRLSAGLHELRVDYYENYGWASAKLEYQPEGGERTLDLPVTVFPPEAGGRELRAIQVDELGNKSESSPAFTVRFDGM